MNDAADPSCSVRAGGRSQAPAFVASHQAQEIGSRAGVEDKCGHKMKSTNKNECSM